MINVKNSVNRTKYDIRGEKAESPPSFTLERPSSRALRSALSFTVFPSEFFSGIKQQTTQATRLRHHVIERNQVSCQALPSADAAFVRVRRAASAVRRDRPGGRADRVGADCHFFHQRPLGACPRPCPSPRCDPPSSRPQTAEGRAADRHCRPRSKALP